MSVSQEYSYGPIIAVAVCVPGSRYWSLLCVMELLRSKGMGVFGGRVGHVLTGSGGGDKAACLQEACPVITSAAEMGVEGCWGFASVPRPKTVLSRWEAGHLPLLWSTLCISVCVSVSP